MKVLYKLLMALTLSSSVEAQILPTMPADGPDEGIYDKPDRYPAGNVEKVNFYSSVAGRNIDMLVYTPPEYTTDKKYGVIYCYQGLGDNAASIFTGDWVRAGIISDNLVGDKMLSQGVIIVAVDDQYDGRNSNLQDMTIVDAVPFIDSNYATYADPDHRGLFGYSLGGGYAFNVGLGNLDYFHYISPSSAAPNKQANTILFPNDGADAKAKLKCLFISWAQYDYERFVEENQATIDFCDSVGISCYSWVADDQGHSGGAWRPECGISYNLQTGLEFQNRIHQCNILSSVLF